MPFEFGRRRVKKIATIQFGAPLLPQNIRPMTIVVHDEFDAQIVFSQLEDYLEKLEHDKETKYGGHPDYCQEDESFLKDAIDHTRIMIHHLSLSHHHLIRKM